METESRGGGDDSVVSPTVSLPGVLRTGGSYHHSITSQVSSFLVVPNSESQVFIQAQQKTCQERKAEQIVCFLSVGILFCSLLEFLIGSAWNDMRCAISLWSPEPHRSLDWILRPSSNFPWDYSYFSWPVFLTMCSVRQGGLSVEPMTPKSQITPSFTFDFLLQGKLQNCFLIRLILNCGHWLYGELWRTARDTTGGEAGWNFRGICGRRGMGRLCHCKSGIFYIATVPKNIWVLKRSLKTLIISYQHLKSFTKGWTLV